MFIGMRGTGDWGADQRPKSWRQNILYLYPNGSAPLTAMMSMMNSKKVPDSQFHWWTQEQSCVSGAVAGIYTNPDLSSAYVSGGTTGSLVYAQITTLLANRIRKGHQILLRLTTDYTLDVVGKVVDVFRGDTNSVLAIKLLEADDNSSTKDLSDCDYFKIIGNINSEGAEMPSSIMLNPTKIYNYTGIHRTSLSMTRTALNTHLRTPNDYQKTKAEALEMHSWELELASIWGIKTENIGDNGKPERTSMGIVNFIKEYAPDNCNDYTLNTDYSGKAWTVGGEDWLKAMLEQIFRFGSGEKLCICGSGFLLGIDKLAQTTGHMNISPGQKTYGMEITNWVTPFGSIKMKTHPLFSFDATTRNMAIILEPKELGFRFITDTKFFGEGKSSEHSEGYGQNRIDGLCEEFLTEGGIEFGLPQKCGILNGVGLDNSLS